VPSTRHGRSNEGPAISALERLLAVRHLAHMVVGRWFAAAIVLIGSAVLALSRYGFVVKRSIVLIVSITWHGYASPGDGCEFQTMGSNTVTWT
jgi:hypothetical protein